MRSKYGNHKTTIMGRTFDSKLEASYYMELELRYKAGEISKFECQPVFLLQEPFRHRGKAQRKIEYIADFRVTYPDGRVEVIDTKSPASRTPDYMIKRKLLLFRYPEIDFKEVKKEDMR